MKIFGSPAAALIATAICFGAVTAHAKTDATKIRDQTDLHGFWQSNGYGYVIKVDTRGAKVFHVTKDFCLESGEASAQLEHYLRDTPPVVSPDKLRAEFRGTLEGYPIALNRLASLPVACENVTADTPQGNFEMFASYFAEHYAFLELYGVDWAGSVAAARTHINDDTTDAQLFDILTELIRPIRDGHVSISGSVDGKDKIFRPNRGFVSETLKDIAETEGSEGKKLGDALLKEYWIKGVGQTILNSKGKLTANDFIQYGMASGRVGYINFLTTAGYANGDLMNERRDLAKLNRVMDRALSQFEKAHAEAIIIDLSTNFGGYDFISRAIAARFAAERTFAHDEFAADSSITKPYRVFIEPYAGKRFEGPVYVLTSNATVSAGEILTLALRALPNVVHAGQATRGAFSDVLEKTLPNGWKVTLSNEVNADAEGTVWEGVGITPELPLPVFEKDDLAGSHPRAVKVLISYIEDASDKASPATMK